MIINKKDFTKETLQNMKSVTRKTKDIEMGFVLCRKNNDKINNGSICVGDLCYVSTAKSKCKQNEENIGAFHTHTTNDIVSIDDLVNAHEKDIICVGRKTLNPFPPFNNRVDCYTVIDKNTICSYIKR